MIGGVLENGLEGELESEPGYSGKLSEVNDDTI